MRTAMKRPTNGMVSQSSHMDRRTAATRMLERETTIRGRRPRRVGKCRSAYSRHMENPSHGSDVTPTEESLDETTQPDSFPLSCRFTSDQRIGASLATLLAAMRAGSIHR